MLSLLEQHFGVFQYLLYISFAYSLMGIYLIIQGIFSAAEGAASTVLVSIEYSVRHIAGQPH